MQRSSGVLMHVTSLPSKYGIGDLGPQAHAFARLLADCGQAVWQILPVNPTSLTSYNDPYHSTGALAGNPLMISPDLLVRDGLIPSSALDRALGHAPDFPPNRVDFELATDFKNRLLDLAFAEFSGNEPPNYGEFLSRQAHWLEDHALYEVLRGEHGPDWPGWPKGLRDRDPKALKEVRKDMAQKLERVRFGQYVFHRQWEELRRACRELELRLFGDMPIYVELDSADCWSGPENFKLGEDRRPTVVSGVPPDYFSATGQLWGTPVYDWEALAATGYAWWMKRLERNLELFDMLRIDHFRGLVAYWEVPADAETAMGGEWVEAPAMDFLSRAGRRFPCLPLVAEDLGVITPDVREAIRAFNLPGMKILLFAFGEDMPQNPYIPHNMERHCLAYTGTHDNNPVRAWFDNEAGEEEKQRLAAYLGHEVRPDDAARLLVRMAQSSPADLAVVPVQDLLGLGAEARMNRPGNLKGNWDWRLATDRLPDLETAMKDLGELSRIFGRSPAPTWTPDQKKQPEKQL